MSDDEINAAIAESLGWSLVGTSIRAGRPPGADYVGSEFIPNYCADLNAMHEAEKGLTDDQYMHFSDCLYDMEHERRKQTKKWRWLSSPARQRAEAFLRALGKWKEAQP